MNGNIMVKCEPITEESELFNSLVTDGNDDLQQQQTQQELRLLCICKLKVSEETVNLLEAHQINVECLHKMRIEDVDVLFDGKPLGWKILFREAFLEWREEIGLPCKSIKMLNYRKRPIDSYDQYERMVENSSMDHQPSTQHWKDCYPPSPQLLNEKDVPTQHENDASFYRTYRWPMTPNTLKDVLRSTSVGRSILSMGCLGSLGKSLQYQLTAIIIDYHMSYEKKITTPQLENYACCITTLLPHEKGATYHVPRGPNRRNPGGSLYSRFINQKISKKALAIGNSITAS